MDDNWADKTSVAFAIPKRSQDETVRVFHVKTQSSSYVLGFFDLGGPRPFAMMRGLSQGMGHDIDLRDSDPRIGSKVLFQTPLAEWVGERIDMAGTKTSPVASVSEEKNPVHTDTMIRTLMQPASAVAKRDDSPPAPRREERAKREEPRATPYPENFVEYVEALASMLRNLASNQVTLSDIAAREQLVARLKVALMNARIAGEDIATRVR